MKLFILLFLTGFIPLSLSVRRKFYLNLTPKTWSAAQTYCRAVHTDLATLETAEEALLLNAEAKRLNYNSYAWIGLYMDVNNLVWSYGNEKLGPVTKWSSGEPGGGTLELCIVLYSYSWADYPCTHTLPFMCLDERNSGTDRYVYYSTYKTWSQAQSYCRQQHTDLVSIRDDTENSDIQAKISLTTEATWIGLYKNAHKWSDQTKFTSFKMLPGEPSYFLDSCICAMNAQGNDAPCTMQLPFFCYRVITGQRRYIRFKIQSDQDVNDPAVKTAVLQKILQKLAEHQITTNITVMWRELLKLHLNL